MRAGIHGAGLNIAQILQPLQPYQLWVWSGVVILGGLVLYAIVRHALSHVANPKTRVSLSRIAGTVITLVVAALLAAIWANNGTSFVLLLGLISAGLAFSLQGPLTSVIGWVVIVALKPFEVGDRVQIGSVSGDVVGFNLFYFSLLEIDGWATVNLYTGRQVEVPNNQLMVSPLYNYSRNFRFLWDNVTVGVYYEADWERARALLLATVGSLTRPLVEPAKEQLTRFGRSNFLRTTSLDPQVFVSLASTTINLSVRYVTDIWDRTRTRSRVVEAVLRSFREAGLDIAYPSVVLRSSEEDGEALGAVPPAARAPPGRRGPGPGARRSPGAPPASPPA